MSQRDYGNLQFSILRFQILFDHLETEEPNVILVAEKRQKN